MNQERDVSFLISSKIRSLEGQKRSLNQRDSDYKKKLRLIDDKIRRVPFEFGVNQEKIDEV